MFSIKLYSLMDNVPECQTRSTRCKEFSGNFNADNSINEWIRIIEK